jgi:DNA primase
MTQYDEVCEGIERIFQHYCGKPKGISYNGDITFICPQCEKPKLGVSPSMRVGHCFVCGVGWNAVTFIQQMEKIDSKSEAVKFGLKLLGTAPSVEPEEHRFVRADTVKGESTAFLPLKRLIYWNIYMFFRVGNWEENAKYRNKLFSGLTWEERSIVDIVVTSRNLDVAEHLRSLDIEEDALRACPGFVIDKKVGMAKFHLQNHILFPYWNVNREYIITFNGRRKYDSATTNDPKYRALVGEKKHLFLPQGVDYTNVKVITEGEKKAIVATARGIPTVAVSGVNCFDTPETRLLQPIDNIIYICYDSEEANWQVLKAEAQLAQYLVKECGLNPKIIRLPSGYKLDDFLLEHGTDAFLSLMKEAKSHEQVIAPQLHTPGRNTGGLGKDSEKSQASV